MERALSDFFLYDLSYKCYTYELENRRESESSPIWREPSPIFLSPICQKNYRQLIEMRPFIQKTFRTPQQRDKTCKDTQTHKHTNKQTNICLQKIYVEGPVQNNEKTKIENVVSIQVILTGPLQAYRDKD